MNKKELNKSIKRATIWKNIYLSNFFTEMKGPKQNKAVTEIISQVTSIDSILDYNTFARKMAKLNNYEFPLLLRCYGGEGLLYGHADSIYKYAGYNKSPNPYYLPAMEHGIDTYERRAMDKDSIAFVPDFVFQGPYKEKSLHSVNPLKPVFVIGPYIHYAELCYSTEELKKLKEKIGKVLLVFPFHCYEFSKVVYSEDKFVDYIMNKLGKNYDTVLISVYWNDVQSDLYKKFESSGAQLVSSGFRGDANFIRRLKTIMSLSDVVVGNSFGTQIGYAYALKKPYIYYDSSLSYVDEKHSFGIKEQNNYDDADNLFKQAFKNLESSDSEKELQDELFCKYWGGRKFVKSPEEMKTMIDAAQQIVIQSHGYTSRFDSIVLELLQNGTEMEKKVLSDSVRL